MPGPLALRQTKSVTSSEQFWAGMQHPELYADLRAAGSLAAALEQVAATLRFDVGEIIGSDRQPLQAELGGAPPLHRRPISVTSAAQVRSFTMNGWSRGVYVMSGSTPEVEELVRAAALWRSGAPLAELQSACPWLKIGELAFAHERGPADAVAVQWSQVRARMEDEALERGIRLVEAAYSEPRLRQLYPYLSHWVLGLSRCTGFPFTDDIPWIGYSPSGDGYEVRRHGWGWSDTERVLAEAATAEEAVALLVGYLPEGTGPAVAGTCDDL